MSTATAQSNLDMGVDEPRRLSTETKNATKTTELIVFVLAVVAVVVTANLYDGSGNGNGGDPFGATTAIRYVVYLTIGYLVSRGLAKSGSREIYDA
jgi:uncharacterized membrane protein